MAQDRLRTSSSVVGARHAAAHAALHSEEQQRTERQQGATEGQQGGRLRITVKTSCSELVEFFLSPASSTLFVSAPPQSFLSQINDDRAAAILSDAAGLSSFDGEAIVLHILALGKFRHRLYDDLKTAGIQDSHIAIVQESQAAQRPAAIVLHIHALGKFRHTWQGRGPVSLHSSFRN
jgi:hypothetical protein